MTIINICDWIQWSMDVGNWGDMVILVINVFKGVDKMEIDGVIRVYLVA